MITVNIDTKPRDLRKMVQKLGRTFTKNHRRAMMRAAAVGRARIDKRTRSGVDVNEKPFRPYSKAYKAFRENRKPALPTNPVRLIFTGKMLGDMQFGMKGQDGIINFSRRTEAKKAAFNNRSRNFFGLNRGDTRAIRDAYFKGLKI